MPFARVELRRFTDDVNKGLNEDRYQLGLTYYFRANNASVRGAWSRLNPNTGPSSNAFTVQLQLFYY
jgi:hypothetical protein